MAYSFQPLYTGENSAVRLPELDALERSIDKSGQMAIKAEEQKLGQHLKDRETFMKLMEVDPVMAISTRDQITQAKLLEEYNNKGAAILKRDGGRLTESGRMELMKEKALLTAQQNKILANQEQWKGAKETITRDVRGYYDRNAFEQAQQEYFKTGEWNPNALIVAPQDITSLLGKDEPQSGYVDAKRVEVKDDKGNIVGHQDTSTEFKRTKEEAQEQIFSKLQHEPVLRFIIEDFEKQPEDVQWEVLKDYDTNGNHKIDPDEKYAYQNVSVRDNPIVKWAMNNPRYLAASMGGNPSVPKNVPKAGGTTFNWTLPVNPSHNQNDTFQEQKNVYGYQSFYNLGRKSFTSDPQMIGEYREQGSNQTKRLDKATRFEVVGYGADKDELLVKITDEVRNPESGTRLKQGSLIVLDASKYDDLLKGKPFGIDRTTLRKGYTAHTTASPKMSFAEWRKANPTKPVAEYTK